MNDKSIRQILISFLLSQDSKLRIYQEKPIGVSVCDLMAVSEILTGYEIKSDADDLRRLERQVEAYDRFFDKNYIVVGESHISEVLGKVPLYWGIVVITEDSVYIRRKAMQNRNVSRRSQLSILWKLELKNLLVKNGMPMYANKSKDFICGKIAEVCEPKMLGEQIAYELKTRDYGIYNAVDPTVTAQVESQHSGSALVELIDSVAETDSDEFTLDKWIKLYSRINSIRKEKQEAFRQPVKDRPAHKIKYEDIEVSLGVPWISEGIINDFARHIIGRDISCSIVSYEPITGNWAIRYKRDYDRYISCTKTYGTKKYNAMRILEATLNVREIRIYDSDNKFDEAETIAVLEKQKLIVEEFRRWIWQDEDRIWEIEEAYNNMFAELEKPVCDGSKLSFPEMSPKYRLYDYQKDAVERIINERNTLLAFDVGAGKTYIMIAAAMKMRSMGISRKNMFVVPNSIVGQWEKIFTELYPKAKLLAIEPKAFKPELRSKILTQMRDGDYDGIIIAYSCFEMIPLSEQYMIDRMQHKIKKLKDDISTDTNTHYDWYAVREREEKYIKNQTSDYMKHSDTAMYDVYFEDLEVNTLFIDEAHNFKNLPLRTKLKNINGINTKGSQKCYDMLMKVRCVQERNGGKGAVLATGTPLCNSISDAYVMQMFVQYDELEKRSLHIFDNWVKTFAEPEQVCEIDVDTSKFRIIKRFSRFFNLPQLSLLFSQAAIFYAVGGNGDIPEFEDYDEVIIEKHAALSDYMKELCKRTEMIRKKLVDRSRDNMLKVSTDGRKAALDLNLVGQEQVYDESSKVRRCADEALRIYNKYLGCSQLIFCDYSTPKTISFNVYSKLKELLTAGGIPKGEIAFIHSYKTEERRLELFRKVNEGTVRILIGSTFKLGIGANVQRKLKAIHHLDVPWRPADMVQREGRILRQGNENKQIRIFRYISEGSFDAYSWQILETKQRFISQFLSGSTYQKSAPDLESNVLSYGEVKALALDSPWMKDFAEKQNELRNLQILRAKHFADEKELEKEKDDIPQQLERLDKKLADAKANKLRMQAVSPEEFKQVYQQHKDVFDSEYLNSERIISLLGFKIKPPVFQDSVHPFVILCSDSEGYTVEMGNSAAGNIRRIINFVKDFDKTIEQLNKRKTELTERLLQLGSVMAESDPYREQIRQCELELEELRRRIEEE